MAAGIIEVHGLHFCYPDGTAALRDCSLSILKGNKVVLLGANGTGKSTLLKHLVGLLKPNKGSITLNGQSLRYDRTSLLSVRSKVGFVFQDPDSQLFSASVSQDISFGPINLGWSRDRVKEAVTKALEMTGTTGLKDKPTHLLSFGQKKLITIAGVLAMEPEIIILDEPTASLDPQHVSLIADLLEKLNKQGTTVVMATHDVDLAYSWADNVFIMKDGKIIKEGCPIGVFQNEDVLRQTSLVKPTILEIYLQLKNNCFLPEEAVIPRSKQQLLELIGKYCCL